MNSRFRAIVRKEWLHLWRDPRSLVVIIVQPIVLLLLYGYALNFDIKNIDFAVLDYDHTVASRQLVQTLRANPYFRFHGILTNPRDIDAVMDAGQVRFVLVIPRGYEHDLASGRDARVQAIFDGADANTAGIALGYVKAFFLKINNDLMSDAAARHGRIIASPIDLHTRFLYNPGLNSTLYLVPGLIGIILTMIAALLTSGTVVRERESGTLELLVSSPLRPMEIMLGKLLPYLALSLIDLLVVVLAGWVMFGIWPKGNLLSLVALTTVFMPCALGIGMLISTLAKRHQTAIVAAFLVSFLPSVLLSGFAFAIQNMPAPVRLITRLVPATYLLIITRGVYLKGVGVQVLLPQVLTLLIFAVVILGIASLRFKKRLD